MERGKVDLSTCQKGDILISAHGAILKYVAPMSPPTLYEHRVTYVLDGKGDGTRTNDGYVFRKKRIPEIDHDIVMVFHFYPNMGLEQVDILDLEGSKYLKSIGYKAPSYYYWLDKDLHFTSKGLKRVKEGQRRKNHNKYDDFIYTAPSRQDVDKWINQQNKLPHVQRL